MLFYIKIFKECKEVLQMVKNCSKSYFYQISLRFYTSWSPVTHILDLQHQRHRQIAILVLVFVYLIYMAFKRKFSTLLHGNRNLANQFYKSIEHNITISVKCFGNISLYMSSEVINNWCSFDKFGIQLDMT